MLSPDTWLEMLSSEPVIAFSLACVLLLVGAMVGWYARWRHERRSRGAPGTIAVTPTAVPGEAASLPKQAAALHDHAFSESERRLPQEWDGGRPRPNLNRQIRLGYR